MTDWVISSDAARNNILHQSLNDKSNLTTFFYAPAYKDFWISARVYGERLGVSEWSNPYHYNSKAQCEPM